MARFFERGIGSFLYPQFGSTIWLQKPIFSTLLRKFVNSIIQSLKDDHSLRLRILAAGALLLLTLLFGFRQEPEQAANFVRTYGYMFTFIALVGFIVSIGCWVIFILKPEGRKPLVRSRFVAFCCSVLFGLGVVFHGSDLDYKILMDDYLLAATAKSLHESGEVSVADFGRTIDGEFTVIHSFVDKRPWLYPFLVSAVHDVFGYNSIHPFIVNAALAVIFLVVVYLIGQQLGGIGGGILAVLLWASLPLLQQNAAGAGMEMLNLLMVHVLILISIHYLRSPSTAGESALCFAGILLTYSRYESGLFLGAIVAVIALGWINEKRMTLSWSAVCAAPLLLAAFLQTRIYAVTESSWELAEAVTSPFALGHLWANIPHAFNFFWSSDFAIANSFLLGLLALPAVFGFGALCFAKRHSDWWKRSENQIWFIFSIFLWLNLAVVLCFHAAQFDQRYVARYSLPTHGLIIGCTIVCLASLRSVKWVWIAAIGITLLFIGGVTLPKNRQALYTKANFMIAEQHWLEEIEREHVNKDALIIDRFSSVWTLREKSSLAPHIALASIARIQEELKVGKYSQIFLVDRRVQADSEFMPQLRANALLLEGFEVELVQAQSFKEGMSTHFYQLRL